jgi:hypothetical protein
LFFLIFFDVCHIAMQARRAFYGKLPHHPWRSFRMTRTIAGLILAFLLTISGISPALSADAPQPTTQEQAQMESMKEFIQANPDCKEFTDQCSVCTLSDGKAECSTPKIACVKQVYQCSAPASK